MPEHLLWRTPLSDQYGSVMDPGQVPEAIMNDGSHVMTTWWSHGQTYHFYSCLLPIHKTFRNNSRSENFIPTYKTSSNRFRVHFIIKFLGDNMLILPMYLVTLFHYNTYPYRCLNSGKRIRLGKPWRQILMPSSTPLHFSCSITSGATNLPACGQHIILKPTSQ